MILVLLGLACVAGLTVGPLPAAAQSRVPVEFRIPAVTAEPGEILNVPVLISDVTGLDVFSCGLVIGYDASIVSDARVRFDGTLTEGWNHAQTTGMVYSADDTLGLISVGMFTVSDPAVGSGTFVNLELAVAKASPGMYGLITFDSVILNDRNPETVTLGGSIRVQSPTVGDFDGDGRVDFSDFLLFANHFGTSSADFGFDPRFDIDGSGQVGFEDFLVFASQFGR